ncbi:hypothetical protein NIES4073_71760 [Kalymmatonema gypsitolerans NIES-4073]|nr:hypothetical protein NIES4073_71760 [Scytonema sp. NIES-4073]
MNLYSEKSKTVLISSPTFEDIAVRAGFVNNKIPDFAKVVGNLSMGDFYKSNRIAIAISTNKLLHLSGN